MDLRENIVITSQTLFLDKGIKSVSMDDIAKELGISKRTLYENFSSKEELLSECLTNMNACKKRQVEEFAATGADIIGIIIFSARQMVENMKNVSPLFLQDISLYHFRLANELFNKHKQERSDKLVAFLQKGQEEGYILKDVNLKLIADLISSNQKVFMQLVTQKSYSFDEVFAHSMLCFIRGMATPKGIARLDEEYLKCISNSKQ